MTIRRQMALVSTVWESITRRQLAFTCSVGNTLVSAFHWWLVVITLTFHDLMYSSRGLTHNPDKRHEQPMAERRLHYGNYVNKIHYVIVDGNWSPWSAWSVCSTTCGVGTSLRVRRCDNPPPAFGGADCGPVSVLCDAQPCYDNRCPGKHFQVYGKGEFRSSSNITYMFML